MKTEYYSINTEVAAEFTVKGSRFITHATPVKGRAEAEKFIHTISNKFHDATHNCFAYKIGVGDSAIFRFSDAGEPSGTAGRPILQAIENKNLTNVAVVVTRYFGGTKLGAGGLFRAYYSATQAALDKAEIVKHHPKIIFKLTFPYPLTNSVHQALHKYDGKILENHFEEESVYLVQLNASDEVNFTQELRDVSKGKICVERENSLV